MQHTAPATPNHRYRIKEDMQESPLKSTANRPNTSHYNSTEVNSSQKSQIKNKLIEKLNLTFVHKFGPDASDIIR